MYKLILILIIGINIYANENEIMSDKFNVLEEKINKIEQKNVLLENENIKLTEKINKLESKEKLVLIKEFTKELNTDSWKNLISFLALFISGYSLYLAYKKDKLKVKVIPVSLNKMEKVFHQSQNYYNHMSSREYFGLEIINYSTFEIKINNIAFFTNIDKSNKYTLNNGFFNLTKEKINFPLTLDAKDSITIWFLIEDIIKIKPNKISIYLATQEKIDNINSKAVV